MRTAPFDRYSLNSNLDSFSNWGRILILAGRYMPSKMKYLYILFLFITLQLNAQNTTKISIKSDEFQSLENYSILEKDSSKQGLYELYYYDQLFKKGQYENDKPVGVWEYYSLTTGEISHKLDLSDSTVVYNYHIWKHDATKYIRDFIILGGFQTFYHHLGESLVYPKRARKKKIEGKVYVQIMINEQGKITEVIALQGPGYGLEEEAIRAIKTIPIEILPALDLSNNPAKSMTILPITFVL